MKKILLIDDEKDFCYFLKKNLEAAGNFEVSVAYDGMSGVRQAREFKPDLILLDMLMPGMGGLEVTEELKANDATSLIPVIFLTAVVRDKEAAEKDTSGAISYVIKPIKIKELVGIINNSLK